MKYNQNNAKYIIFKNKAERDRKREKQNNYKFLGFYLKKFAFESANKILFATIYFRSINNLNCDKKNYNSST